MGHNPRCLLPHAWHRMRPSSYTVFLAPSVDLVVWNLAWQTPACLDLNWMFKRAGCALSLVVVQWKRHLIRGRAKSPPPRSCC